MLGEAIDMIGVRINGSNSHIAYKHVFGHTLGSWINTFSKRSHLQVLIQSWKPNEPQLCGSHSQLDCLPGKRKSYNR